MVVLACLILPLGESHASTRFAVISDLGSTVPTAASPVGPIVTAVANQVKAGQPDLILTAGDNCHDTGGGAPTGYYDIDVGQYFHEYIGGYVGAYGEGAPANRFWPALGNHDYADGLAYYKAFFPSLANQRYYDFTAGAAHFFVLDCNVSDGNSPTSAQAQWLQAGLAASTSPWNFVFVHEPPYTSSDRHSPSTGMRWNYKAWGADAVFAGHVHAYERMVVDGLTYFTTGAAGETLAQGFVDRLGDQSLYYFRGDYGGMQVDVDGTQATFWYVTRTGLVIDTHTQAVQANEFTATGGSYNVAGHWQRGRVVSAPDAVALFQQPLAGPVTVDAPVTLGTLALHSPGGSTLAGPAAVRFETTGGTAATLSAQGGSHVVLAPLIMAGDTRIDVQAGTLTLANHTTVQAGAVLAVTGTGLAIDTEAGGTLDLGTGSLIVDYDAGAGPLTQVADWVRSGLNAAGGGYWDGPGIASSDAAGQADRLTAVGILDNGDPTVGGKETFAGEAVDATSVLVHYTWWGDANLDGVIDANDYEVIDKGFLFTPETMGWWTGDFNYDGMIDANDYDRIDKAFLFQTGPLGDPEPAAAPEPATILLLALGALAATAVRRRS